MTDLDDEPDRYRAFCDRPGGWVRCALPSGHSGKCKSQHEIDTGVDFDNGLRPDDDVIPACSQR